MNRKPFTNSEDAAKAMTPEEALEFVNKEIASLAGKKDHALVPYLRRVRDVFKIQH